MEYDFSEEVEFTPEWNKNREAPEDQQIKTTLTLLDMGELIELIAITSKANQDTEDGEASIAGTALMFQAAKDFLPKHVVLSNFKTKKGVELNIDTIVRFPVFMNFMAELLAALIDASTPSEEDVGNSKGQSG